MIIVTLMYSATVFDRCSVTIDKTTYNCPGSPESKYRHNVRTEVGDVVVNCSKKAGVGLSTEEALIAQEICAFSLGEDSDFYLTVQSSDFDTLDDQARRVLAEAILHDIEDSAGKVFTGRARLSLRPVVLVNGVSSQVAVSA